MKLAIMQPYFLPYIGYFQLIGAVDLFVVYDNIKYTKKGWINRNRMLRDGSDAMFSLPLKGDSDHKDVRERELAADFRREKLLQQFAEGYRRAPCLAQTMALLEQVILYPETNLFRFLDHSIHAVCGHLGIRTEIRISSTVPIDHGLKAQDKVIALCKALGADTYVNPIGGVELYSREEFASHGIELQFLRARPFEYPQLGDPFVPWLSIADVLMFNPPDHVREHLLPSYELN